MDRRVQPDPWIESGRLGGDFLRPVRGAVVNNHEFPVVQALGPDRIDRATNRRLGIIGREEDADSGALHRLRAL